MLTKKDIPNFTKFGNYEIDVPLGFLLDAIEKYKKDYQLDTSPDFQRAHVWNEQKQIKYVEFLLRGGLSSRVLYFNCPNWMGVKRVVGPMVLVDGKQRLEALTKFLTNNLMLFGKYKLEDIDRSVFRISKTMKIHINNLETRKDVLQWYIDINDGGVAHTTEEILKVKELLDKESMNHG